MADWQPIETAPENVAVLTKIDDEQGGHNVQPLKLRKGLWWLPDDYMYVYYVPTHWKPLKPLSFFRKWLTRAGFWR